MEYPQLSEILEIIPIKSHGKPSFSYGFPMVSLWFSYGFHHFPMLFLSYFPCFTRSPPRFSARPGEVWTETARRLTDGELYLVFSQRLAMARLDLRRDVRDMYQIL